MAYLDRHPRARWAAPVVAAAVAVGGGLALGQTGAGASTGLPPKTVEQLLVALQQARPQPLSGTVRQEVDLGLPDLSALGGAASSPGGAAGSNPLALLTGSHTWRVWYADPQHARVSLVDGSSEQAVVRNGRDVWQWSSADQSVHHVQLPATLPTGGPEVSPSAGPQPGPQALAQQVLAALDPTTQVSASSTDTVAGRAAYGLVLTPRSPDTLVGSVRLSLDAVTSLPLAASVYAKGAANPAVDVRFTALDLGTPAASTFTFTPPPGAKVTEETTPTPPMVSEQDATASGVDKPRFAGTGWSTVAVGAVPGGSASFGWAPNGQPTGPGGASAALLGALPKVSGSWGSGHLLSTTLVTAVLTDDGRYAVGAVPPSALYAALSRP